MTEEVHHDYEVRSEGAGPNWGVPYARLTDDTPTPTNAAELTSLIDGTQLTGTILTIDAADSVAVIDFTPGQVYWHEVRNVLTYNPNVAELSWGAINIGDLVYYDHSATMLALGLQLSTSPLSFTGATNTRFGVVMKRDDTDMALFPKGDNTASTEDCAVMQLGAGGP